MARIYDPYSFHATIAFVSWAGLAREQKLEIDVEDVPPTVQLRWMVNSTIGLSSEPFVVWDRRARAELGEVEVRPLGGEGWTSSILPEPMVTVEVDITPDNDGDTVTLSGYVDYPSATTLAVATSDIGYGSTTLQVRASGIRQFIATGGTVTAVRGESVAHALADRWDVVEVVGLPVDDSWSGTTYRLGEQGLVSSPTSPPDAAVGRLKRGLAPFGWRPVTSTYRPVPPWEPCDPSSYVAEMQAPDGILALSQALFADGVPPDAQIAIKPILPVDPPQSRGQTARGVSTAGVPLLGTLLVGPGNDSAAALGLGFGTAYPVGERPSQVVGFAGTDVMVTALYPSGIAGDGNEVEYAVVLPIPHTMHQPPSAPTGLTAERAGLLLPATDTAAWTETIRLNFARVLPSVSLERPSVGALARYPDFPGPAELALEPDPAGGWRSLLLAPRPSPNAGQIALVDSVNTDLPIDLSARTIGHAVAVADVYGTWSAWADVSYSSGAPPYPIPQVVSVRPETSYSGSTSCPASITSDVVIDWQTRTPAEIVLRVAVCPVAYAGAPLPGGVGPFGVPAGCRLDSYTLSQSGGLLAPSPPDLDIEVEYLTADGSDRVQPSDPGFPEIMSSHPGGSRRYRITVSDLWLDFAATAHYAVAIWAQELTTVPGAPWGEPAAVPVVGYVSSPVPPVVSFTAPPTVPLGSIPDADNISHVTVSTAGITGATAVSVWSVSESRLFRASPPQTTPGTDLPSRYQAMQAAYDSLGDSAAKRAPFTRYGTYPAGTTSVDVSLPRGSREITLFAVTAVNAAGVESAWPASHSGLQAATAPATAAPTMPVVSASLDAGGTTFSVTMSAQSRLPIISFEIYATRVADAAASVGSMGPPLQVVTATAVPAPSGTPLPPAGHTYSAVAAGLPVGSGWRPLRLRVVAVPAAKDDATGTFGLRSPASPVFQLFAPPPTPPDLSALTVHGWGTGDGVRVAFSSGLPLDVGSVRVVARAGGSVLFDGGGRLAGLPRVELPAASPPAGASSGVVVRGTSSGGVFPYEAWFERPDEGTAVATEVIMRDALGRVSVRSVTVPGGTIDPPVITVNWLWRSGPYLLSEWTTDTPPDDGTGACLLTITGAGTRLSWPIGTRVMHPIGTRFAFELPDRLEFTDRPELWPVTRPTVSETFRMPDIRDYATGGLRPVDVDVVRRLEDGVMLYTCAVRISAPGSMTLTITTPAGQTGTARLDYS